VEQEVVLEVVRRGRRPRYHRGGRNSAGVLLKPEQCNTDDAGLETRVLDYLPVYPAMRRPWRQLCRRCWRGSGLLEAADALHAALETDGWEAGG